jgi:hypothetical protein
MTLSSSWNVTTRQHITREGRPHPVRCGGRGGNLRHSDVVFYSLCATPRQVNCA